MVAPTKDFPERKNMKYVNLKPGDYFTCHYFGTAEESAFIKTTQGACLLCSGDILHIEDNHPVTYRNHHEVAPPPNAPLDWVLLFEDVDGTRSHYKVASEHFDAWRRKGSRDNRMLDKDAEEIIRLFSIDGREFYTYKWAINPYTHNIETQPCENKEELLEEVSERD